MGTRKFKMKIGIINVERKHLHNLKLPTSTMKNQRLKSELGQNVCR